MNAVEQGGLLESPSLLVGVLLAVRPAVAEPVARVPVAPAVPVAAREAGAPALARPATAVPPLAAATAPPERPATLEAVAPATGLDRNGAAVLAELFPALEAAGAPALAPVLGSTALVPDGLCCDALAVGSVLALPQPVAHSNNINETTPAARRERTSKSMQHPR